MAKKDNDTRGLADVEMYFNQIRSLLKQYRCVVLVSLLWPRASL